MTDPPEQVLDAVGRTPVRRELARWQAVLAAVVGCLLALGASLFVGVVVQAFAMLDADAAPAALEAGAASLPLIGASIAAVSVTLLLTAILTPLIARVRVRDALGLRGAPLASFVAGAVGIVGLGPASDLLVSAVASVAPDLTFGSLTSLYATLAAHPVWVMLPLAALVPGVSEELFFRGMLQRALGTAPWAVLVSGCAFALFHLDPHHVVGVLPVGLYLAWLAARSGSTLVPVVAHITANAVAVLASHVPALQVGYGTDRPMPLWLPPLGLIATALAVYTVVRVTRRAPSRTPSRADGEPQ